MVENNIAVVTIDEVNMPLRLANVLDKTRGKFQVSFRNSPAGILYVPSQGEKWVIRRVGHIWYLESKLDSADDHAWAVANMKPGEVRIKGSKIYLEGTIDGGNMGLDGLDGSRGLTGPTGPIGLPGLDGIDGAPGPVSLTGSTNYISADVTITTASTFYDGPTLSLAAGTWFLTGNIQLLAGSTAIRTFTAKLWDGTTTISKSDFATFGTSANANIPIALSGIVIPSSTTTYKISATSTVSAVDVIKGTTPSDKNSYLIAVKIA